MSDKYNFLVVTVVVVVVVTTFDVLDEVVETRGSTPCIPIGVVCFKLAISKKNSTTVDGI